jgi:hypothetical protein
MGTACLDNPHKNDPHEMIPHEPSQFATVGWAGASLKPASGFSKSLSGLGNRGNPAAFPGMRWQFNPDGRAPME